MNTRIRFTVATVAMIALVGWSSVAWAQGRGMRGGGPSFSRLLSMEEVQKELKLEGTVLEKVKAYAEESAAKMREEFQMIRDQGLGEADMREEMAALADQMYNKDSEALKAILSGDQLKRLKQLFWQQQGAMAVTRKEVGEAIGLSEDEIAKIKKKADELNNAAAEKMRELFQDGDRDKIQAAMTENRKALEDAVMGMLSDSQKEKLKEIKGAEFKFPEPQQRARRDF